MIDYMLINLLINQIIGVPLIITSTKMYKVTSQVVGQLRHTPVIFILIFLLKISDQVTWTAVCPSGASSPTDLNI